MRTQSIIILLSDAFLPAQGLRIPGRLSQKALLERTIQKALNQRFESHFLTTALPSHAHFEVVVVLNGLQIEGLQYYFEECFGEEIRNGQLVLVSKTSNGPAYLTLAECATLGAEKAQGAWLNFIYSGDTPETHWLDRLISEQNHSDLVVQKLPAPSSNPASLRISVRRKLWDLTGSFPFTLSLSPEAAFIEKSRNLFLSERLVSLKTVQWPKQIFDAHLSIGQTLLARLPEKSVLFKIKSAMNKIENWRFKK